MEKIQKIIPLLLFTILLVGCTTSNKKTLTAKPQYQNQQSADGKKPDYSKWGKGAKKPDFVTAMQSDKGAQNNDPLEGYNRAAFGVSDFFDTYLISPVAKTYDFIVPEVIQMPIRNFLNLWSYPMDIINYSLQGDFDNAGRASKRFFASAILTAGTMDIGDNIDGDTYKGTTFSATLASFGAPEGDFVVIPLLPPSTVRGYIGFGIDLLSKPNAIVPAIQELSTERVVISILNSRTAADKYISIAKSTSLDYYTTVRSFTLAKEKGLTMKFRNMGKTPSISARKAPTKPKIKPYADMDLSDEDEDLGDF